MKPRQRLRAGLNNPQQLIRVVGAHNALGAKLIERNGFDAVWASGFEISTAHAKPDANILSMTELLYCAEQMVEATVLPIIADCDTGFGNINNVVRMIKEYEKAGVAAVCIEDKVFPKMNSFIPGRQELAPVEEFCGKISAAKDAQTDEDFMVIARIEALIANQGMEEALYRAEMYREVGADMILIHSKLQEPVEIIEFCNKWKHDTPIVIVPTTYPNLSLHQMKELQIKVVIYANQALRASVKAVNHMLETLRISDSLSSISSQIAQMDELFDLQGMKEYVALEKEYKDRHRPKVIR
ncbi:phosphoenolpyruvate mutase [Paenibacillus glacialis]|uniref:phosphoenolpyruvate mutase n=1 Tax=Paenibacillus glacialis TaxID=494026 RepID=A0A168D0U2_9BACL|nr:phosphoenolpyruvate mutase [Paenibacillus glacialis]OAB33777.1 phosphoenolpyruvate phosphomutase [Paenibacillus glacialis]